MFLTAAPNEMFGRGFTKASLKMGQEVTVTGVRADDGRKMPSGEIVARADLIRAQDGTVVWDRATPLTAPQTR